MLSHACLVVTEHIDTSNGRYISDEAFVEQTDVIITRSAFTSAGWSTILIGECDTGNESVIYNAVYHPGGFENPQTEITYNYTVHEGRKLVIFRRNNNWDSYTLTVTK